MDDIRNCSSQSEFKFNPNYGYSLDELLAVPAPREPKRFDEFWQRRYRHALAIEPDPYLKWAGYGGEKQQIFDIQFTSTDNFRIGGWLLLPKSGQVKRGFVIGHGYGGRTGPDLHLPFYDAALLFPCFRGISRSSRPGISSDPFWHVRHDINNLDKYILGGCVEDVWLAVSALLKLFPQLAGRLGYLGISFGGGIGALALAFEQRIARAHLNVPTFGNQPLRLRLPSQGSANSVQQFYRNHKKQTLKTLSYFDAATAAKRITAPVHCACALFDPYVAPPGQFSVYNALPKGNKTLFVLEAGHYSYPNQQRQEQELLSKLERFFNPLTHHC